MVLRDTLAPEVSTRLSHFVLMHRALHRMSMFRRRYSLLLSAFTFHHLPTSITHSWVLAEVVAVGISIRASVR